MVSKWNLSDMNRRRYNKQMLQQVESCCQAPWQQWCSVTLSKSHGDSCVCARCPRTSISIIGGSRGGAWGTHAPPGHPNSFDFMQFSGKFGVFTPPLEGSRPPPRENPRSATVYGKSWATSRLYTKVMLSRAFKMCTVQMDRLYLRNIKHKNNSSEINQSICIITKMKITLID